MTKSQEQDGLGQALPPLPCAGQTWLAWMFEAGLWPRVAWHFLNGKDTFAFQFPDNTYRPSKKLQLLLRPEFQEKILAGERSVGFYTPNGDRTRWACLDFDCPKGYSTVYHRAREAYRWLASSWQRSQYGYGVLLACSSTTTDQRSYHVWVVWADFVSAQQARQLLRQCLRATEFERQAEIFPKTDRAAGWGNLVRLFGMYHQAKHCWGLVRDLTPGFFDLLTTDVPAQTPRPPDPSPATEQDILYWAVTKNLAIPGPGSRHQLMLKLIARLRYRQVDHETAEEIYGRWLTENSGQFRTSFSDAVKEFRRAWKYAAQTLRDGFQPPRLEVDPADPAWAEVYAALGERQRQALDYIRTLPGHTESFFLSSYDLGEKLNLPPMAAWRVLRSLEARGVLVCLHRYPPGHPDFRRKANEYRVLKP